jgi:hypothetical protein
MGYGLKSKSKGILNAAGNGTLSSLKVLSNGLRSFPFSVPPFYLVCSSISVSKKKIDWVPGPLDGTQFGHLMGGEI